MLKHFVISLLLLTQTHAFGIGKASSFKGSAQKLNLPKPDSTDPSRFLPPDGSSNEYYSPIETVLRAGPVPAIARTFQSDKYEQAVLRYMYESRTSDWTDAQANMDAFFAAPDVWTEQKLLEQQGKREVYNYGVAGKPTVERIILSTGWAAIVTVLFSRVFWQLIHGNRNLF